MRLPRVTVAKAPAVVKFQRTSVAKVVAPGVAGAGVHGCKIGSIGRQRRRRGESGDIGGRVVDHTSRHGCFVGTCWHRALVPTVISPCDHRAVLFQRHDVTVSCGNGLDSGEPAGTEICPKLLAPQTITVPSSFNATVLRSPAAIALTPERPSGTVVCPKKLIPMRPPFRPLSTPRCERFLRQWP